jgi:hypothetical protein
VSYRSLVLSGGVFALMLAGPALGPPGEGRAGSQGPWTGWALSAQNQGELTVLAAGVARAWAGGSDQAVVQLLVQGQVRLHLDGGVSATLPTRQASAALRDYLRRYQAGQVEVARVSLVEGAGERGFIELRWTAQRAGTSQPLRRTVFLGLRHDGRSWGVDEVRVMH